MAIKLSDNFPIYDITKNGVVIGDNKASLSVCFEISFPIVFTLGEEEYQNMIEDFRKFLELLGEDVLIHIQTFFHREFFSIGNIHSDLSNRKEDFIERAYQHHFNERPYLKSKSFIYISKIQSSNSIKSSIVSKDFMKTDDKVFIDNILNSAFILEKHEIKLRFLSQEELVSPQSPISKYFTLSSADIEELKDIDFSDNKVYVGAKEVKIYSIQEGEQFPTGNIYYHQYKNGLPISNISPFSYSLGIPHILNQYIYIPNQKEFTSDLDTKMKNLNSFNVKGANDDALTDVFTFKDKMSKLGLLGVYFHTNIMCFDASHKEIEESINNAFSEAGFKKKEVTLLRKDLFWAGVPTNGSLLVNQKKNLMESILDLEACAFLSLEQNYEDDLTANNTGIRLCDRIYGIPFEIDIYNAPKKKGWIKNENTIILAGSGGGKSFLANLIFLGEYRQGNHIFVIDASFSYKLQCAMHNGIYLTFNEKNKISFNPFYIDWLKDPKAKNIFSQEEEAKYQLNSDIDISEDEKVIEDNTIETYKNYLENKISVLMGIISTMTKHEKETTSKFERTIYRASLFNYFKDRCLNNKIDQCKFDDFYNFISDFLPQFLREKKIENIFNINTFKLMLDPYRSNESLGYLLNSEDPKIKNIDKERFVVIDVSKITKNEDLYPIVSALAMDLYNQKVAKLPIGVKKILCIDEAWQSISSPDMAVFMKSQVKVIRKYGGRTVFITQEPDDFTSSEIIKDSIINNSSVKIYLDMGEFRQKFEPIKKVLAISDNNENKIKSLNQNNRANSFYKEACFCWESYGQVYAIETPLELKAIFETDPDEVAKILPQYEKYGVELTAVNYANR